MSGQFVDTPYPVMFPAVYGDGFHALMRLRDLLDACTYIRGETFTVTELFRKFRGLSPVLWNGYGDALYQDEWIQQDGKILTGRHPDHHDLPQQEDAGRIFIKADWGKRVIQAVQKGGKRAEMEFIPGGLFRSRGVRATVFTQDSQFVM